jgi:nitrite reductase/ring-hydroxylating ferredoxin subunit
MNELVEVAQADKLTPDQRKLVNVKGHDIALFNVAGTYYAISNSCPHSRGPLVEGRLFGTTVVCPWHGSQFDVTNGHCQSVPATRDVDSYPVHVEGQSIYIEI